MASEKRINKPTPNGGAYSIAYFLNDKQESVDEEQATQVEIVEFSSEGEQVHRTYGSIGRKNDGTSE